MTMATMRSEGARTMPVSPTRPGGGRRVLVVALSLLTLGALGEAAPAWADARAGETLFKQCSGCHMVGPDAVHRFGPQLNGLMERGAGQATDYAYSSAFQGAVAEGLDWSESLDAYLEAPMTMIPGTRMAYPGIERAEDRASVVEYLSMIGPDGELPTFDSPGATHQQQASGSDATLPERARIPAAEVPVPDHGVLHLGRPALDEEVAAWNMDIRPDGQGLPPGSGSVETGGALYDVQCASCHGVFGEGEGRWPVLAGGQDSLTDERPEKTIGSYWPYLSTVFDYVRRAMPYGNTGSLSDDDVYALTAYLLYLNDLVDDDFTLDSASFAEVEMPNVGNFTADTRSEEPFYGLANGTEPCMSDCADAPAEIVQTARILDVTPDSDEDESGAGGID